MYFLFTKFEKSSFWASEALLSLDWKKIIKSYFLYQGLKAYLVCRLFDIHAASIATYSFWKIIIVLKPLQNKKGQKKLGYPRKK